MIYQSIQTSIRRRFTPPMAMVAFAVCFGLPTDLHAITFDMNYIAGNSSPPAEDLTGALLTSHMQAAANHWADILEDSWTMEVNFWWGDQADGTIATAAVLPPTGDGKRTMKGQIIFDATPTSSGLPVTYFYDPTPSINEEFDLAQGLYRDLSAADKTAIYNVTSATPLLEESFSGLATVPAAQGAFTFDIMSFAYHELGHLLGVTPQLPNGASEVADNDFDLTPGLLAGRVMAVNSVGGGHVAEGAGGNLLMQDGLLGGQRYLPSATDVLTAASVSKWTQIDLPRQDLLAGSTWNVPSNWEGAQLPGSADDAYVRLGGTIELDIADSVGNLFVGAGTVLRTNNHQFNVATRTTIAFDGTFPFARLVVETGGELVSPNVDVNGGQLDMEGGQTSLRRLVVNPIAGAGSVVGFGTVDVANSLINDGTIAGGNGQTLAFTSNNSGALFDLDGADGNGRVEAIGGNLTFSANVDPNFAGDMVIANSREISIANPWTLSPGGTLTLDGNSTAFASANLRGGELTVGGTIDVDKKVGLLVPATITQQANLIIPDSDDSLELGLLPAQTITLLGGTISGNGSLNANGSVNVPAGRSPVIDVNTQISGPLSVAGDAIFQRNLDLAVSSSTTLSNGALLLNGETTFRGGSFTGNGFVFVNDAARMVDDQTINITGMFDLDGQNNDAQVFIESGKTFNLNATSIDGGNNDFDGEIRLTNGALIINVDADLWTMAGELLMTGFGGAGSGFAGDAVDFTGALIASAGPTHFVAANTRMLAGSTTSVAFGTRLQYNAPVIYEGGNHTVDGEIAIADSATINGGNLTAVEMEVGGSATVTVNGGNTTVNGFNKLAGGAFDFNGGTFRVSTGTAMFNSNVEYGGQTLEGQPTLVAENGGEAVVSFRVSIGDGVGEFGAARISGTSSNGSKRSSLRGAAGGAGADLNVGDAGTGSLVVENGGFVQFRDDLVIGVETGSSGTATVRGVSNAGGILNRAEIDVTLGGANSLIQIGRFGTGVLNVEDGALVRTSDDLIIANGAGSQGTVSIGGEMLGQPAELEVAAIVDVGAVGPGEINLAAGGRLTASRLNVRPNATINMTGGELVLNQLDTGGAGGGGALNMTGGRLHVANVFGDLAHSGGVLAPGASPGTTDITGNYDQSAGGTLEIELAGLVAGSEFDQLDVVGTALLGGSLDVLLTGGFTPVLGNTFEIVTAGIVLDTFTSVNLPTIGNLGWAINYNPTNVLLEVVVPIPGDFDGDFDVDGADFLAIQRSDPSLIPAWEANFGQFANASPTSSAVPEPGTLATLVSCALLANCVSLRRPAR